MRKIVSICWNNTDLSDRTRQWVARHVLDLGRIHQSMKVRLQSVEGWLRESEIHPSYVEVILEEVEYSYLRPCTNMVMIERTNFTEMYRRFRGTGSQFFNLPTILTLYIMASKTEVCERYVKLAIREGVQLCKRNKLLLENVSESLIPFGMRLDEHAQKSLLRSSLNLVPMSYSPYNSTSSVLLPLIGSSAHPPRSHMWDGIERFVRSLLFSSSLVVQQEDHHHLDPMIIRNVLEYEHESAAEDSMVIMAPWVEWSTENHRWIAAPWARILVRGALLMLLNKGVRGDLAVHVVRFLFCPLHG
jgi:hypothetical protein